MLPEYTVLTVAGMIVVVVLELFVVRSGFSANPPTGLRWESVWDSKLRWTGG